VYFQKQDVPMFDTMQDAMNYIFQSRRRLDVAPRGLDEETRDVSPTRKILIEANLLDTAREYVVVTGSRGKGSVTSIMAKLLQSLGHTVGMLTSPHLVHWNERIRINGRMIPTEDFLRILSDLRPTIDLVTDKLNDNQYLSPQGVFLAIALQLFNEQDVNVAVLEVGRGGRYDDVSIVPNKLSVFTPIMYEHTALLGSTLERIAWHKAGIISQNGQAVSVPQAPEVMKILSQEADSRDATFTWLANQYMATWIADRPDGQQIQLGRYGELFLPLLGRYQIENASLAIQAVGMVHARLHGIPHTSPEYVQAIKDGLAQVKWLGRVQQLESNPLVYVDGAITVVSAQSFVESVESHITSPVASIVGVPVDRDYAGVYQSMANISQSLIITENHINPKTQFPARDDAITTAQAICDDVHYTDNLPDALDIARTKVGTQGTILIAGSLMIVGECMLIWDVDTSVI